jgi:uncharacterized membrane protein
MVAGDSSSVSERTLAWHTLASNFDVPAFPSYTVRNYKGLPHLHAAHALACAGSFLPCSGTILMKRGCYSLRALLVCMGIVCVFLAAIAHPTYNVAIASRVLTFCLAMGCLISVLGKRQYHGGAAAALVAGAIWFNLIGHSLAFVIGEWAFSAMLSFEEGGEFSSAYLATILNMSGVVAVSTIMGVVTSLLNGREARDDCALRNHQTFP